MCNRQHEVNHVVAEAIEIDFGGEAATSDLARLLEGRGYSKDEVYRVIGMGIERKVLESFEVRGEQYVCHNGVSSS